VQIPPPPEPAVEIYQAFEPDVYGGEFYLVGRDEKVFGYACNDWMPCSWRWVPTPPAVQTGDPAIFGCQETTLQEPPPLEQEPLDRFTIKICFSGAEVQYSLALMDPQELLLWKDFRSDWNVSQLGLFFAGIGAFFGFSSLWLLRRNMLPGESTSLNTAED
jgi:hypothetical protein